MQITKYIPSDTTNNDTSAHKNGSDLPLSNARKDELVRLMLQSLTDLGYR